MMASLTQGSYRAYGSNSVRVAPAVSGRIVIRAIASATLLGAAVTAAAFVGAPAYDAARPDVLAKASRLAPASANLAASFDVPVGAAMAHDSAGRLVYLNDPSARTTTVARNVSVPLSAASPYPRTAP